MKTTTTKKGLIDAPSRVPDAGAETMRRFVQRKHRIRAARNRALWEKAAQDADRIVEAIAREFDPKSVYQWGSVLTPESFDEHSDIDIAVEGLGSARRYFELLARAESLTGFPLDIVEMEHVEPAYAALIRRHGRRRYPAAPTGKDRA